MSAPLAPRAERVVVPMTEAEKAMLLAVAKNRNMGATEVIVSLIVAAHRTVCGAAPPDPRGQADPAGGDPEEKQRARLAANLVGWRRLNAKPLSAPPEGR